MKTAISVLTCAGRPQYLAATLASLDAAGASAIPDRIVHCDGWQPCHRFSRFWENVPCAGEWWWTGTAVPSGVDHRARAAMFSALHTMSEEPYDYWDQLIYCEDDIVCAPHAIERIAATPIRDNQALISFYDSNEFSSARLAEEGIHDVPIMGMGGKGLFGACCLLIPRRTLKYILDKYPRPDHPEMPPHADQALSWALRDSPWPVRGVAIPSLVEHVGEISSMGHNAGKAAWFEGT